MTATAYTALARIAGGSRLSLSVHIKEDVSIFKENYENIYYFLFSKTSFSKELLDLRVPNVELVSLNKMMDV